MAFRVEIAPQGVAGSPLGHQVLLPAFEFRAVRCTTACALTPELWIADGEELVHDGAVGVAQRLRREIGIDSVLALMIGIIGVGEREFFEHTKLRLDQVQPGSLCGCPCRVDVQLFE
jgi:hypothetical protein